MAKLKIVKEGDPLLRKTSRPVTEITPRILTLLDDMAETMRAADGVGLAAVQVGVLRRVVVIETEAGKLIELINPRIIESEGEQEEAEGCLSIPGKYGITHRQKRWSSSPKTATAKPWNTWAKTCLRVPSATRSTTSTASFSPTASSACWTRSECKPSPLGKP